MGVTIGVRVEESICVLRGLGGGSKESSRRAPPRGLWKATRPPVPPLHYNRLLVCESLSLTLDSSLYNSQGLSRTSLRCSAESFFSASLSPVLLQLRFLLLSNPALSRTENSRLLFFLRLFPAHVSPDWFSGLLQTPSSPTGASSPGRTGSGNSESNCITLGLA